MTSYEKIADYIEHISTKIEAEFSDVDFSLLNIWIVFQIHNIDKVYDGSCHTNYKKTKMKIEIMLPNLDKIPVAVKRNLALILIHEYCHYIDAMKRSAEERHEDGCKYSQDPKHVYLDERRTWNQTKALAIKLNLWSKRMYNLCMQYRYTSNLEP